MVRVCPECFNRSIFKRRVQEARAKSDSVEKCDWHPRRKGVDLNAIGPIVDRVFRDNFTIGEFWIDHQKGDELGQVIADITGAEDQEVADAISEWLTHNDYYYEPGGGEPFYAIDQCYTRTEQGGWIHSARWHRFRRDVLYRQRFFNENARELLNEIFEGVQFQADAKGRPAFYDLGPADKKQLYRARILTSEDEAKRISAHPEVELGPPPPSLRRAGRMNAAGISVFYGALDAGTAVAELRPPVGSNLAIASFHLTRPVHVLDLTRFSGQGKTIDMFSLNHVKRTSQWAFMLSFAAEISKPILPGDEHLEYVPAQIVAEHLVNTLRSWKGGYVTVDAIIFGSSQRKGGRNIVILGDSAVVVQVPRKHAKASFAGDDFDPPANFGAERNVLPALKYVDKSLTFVEVESAEFKRVKVERDVRMDWSSPDY